MDADVSSSSSIWALRDLKQRPLRRHVGFTTRRRRRQSPCPCFKAWMFRCAPFRQLLRQRGLARAALTKGFSGSAVPSTGPVFPSPPPYTFSTDVVRPVLFGVGTSAVAFSIAAHVSHKKQSQPAEYELKAWNRAVPFGLGRDGASLHKSDLSLLAKLPVGTVRDTAASLLVQWRNLQPHQQTLYGITVVNLLVLAAWRPRLLQGFMQRNFLHHFPPVPTRMFTLLTSTFSHKTLIHFVFNSVALVSFGGAVHDRLGSEQFLAVFVSGGLASSVLSHLARVKRRPGGASLGSSGAVYAIFAMMAHFEPQAKAAFIFLPGVPIALENLFPGLVLLDVVGALSRWRILDHWGHLGGALFGYWYARYGQGYIWGNRDKLFLPGTE